MSLRIAVVTTSFPRDEDDPSGHFVRSHSRAVALAASGDRLGAPRSSAATVHIIAPLPRSHLPSHLPSSAALDHRPPLIIHRVAGASLFASPGALARAAQNPLRLTAAPIFLLAARRELRGLAPIDQLIAHWIVPCAWPILAGTTAPLHVVSHGADVRLLARAPAPLRDAVVRSLIERGATFQFVATQLLDTLAAALPGALADRLRASSRVEPAPIDLPDVTSDAASKRASLDLRSDELLAVCAGRLIADKRCHLAIAAAAELSPRVRLILIGDGPERARLEAIARDHGPCVTFTGALPRRRALAWIAAADVLVHPSAHEGAPTVIREARALGTSVVACASGDVERWAERDAAIHIAAPTARALAAAILRAAPRRSAHL